MHVGWPSRQASVDGRQSTNNPAKSWVLRPVGMTFSVLQRYNPPFSAQERQQHLRARPTDDNVHDRPTNRKDCIPNVRPSILPAPYLSVFPPSVRHTVVPVFFVFLMHRG